MSADVLPFDGLSDLRANTARALAPVRQVGGTEIVFRCPDGRRTIADVAESGGYRVRLPETEEGIEAVLINTGGGMVGGDRVEHVVSAAAGACALVTTPAAERVYRTLGPRSEVRVQLTAAQDARLVWLPQETILYDGAALVRRLDAAVDPSARLLVAEVTAFGRVAMGETLKGGLFRDTWRIRRGKRLVFAESVAIEGDIGRALQRPAVGGGARVAATLLYVGDDAADRLEAVRDVIAMAGDEAAASSWNDLLVVRILGFSLSAARGYLARVVPLLTGRAMPRMWWT